MFRLKLANVMGMDMDKAQHGVGIVDALTGIEDQEAFIEFCRDKKDGIEYSNRVEKLDTLAQRYKKLQVEAKLPHNTAHTFSSNLANKVLTARSFIKNEINIGNAKPFSSIVLDGEKYFTDKETKALSELGSSNYLIELSEQNILSDKLTELFLSKYIAKAKYESLTQGQKKVQALIGAGA